MTTTDTHEVFPPKGTAHRAVLVTNLNPETTEEGLEDFFSFCGKITSLKMRPSHSEPVEQDGQTEEPSPSKEAIVVFESRSAQQVALLLNNAVLNERHIVVAKAPEDWNVDGATTAASQMTRETGAEEPRSRSSMAEAFSDTLKTLAEDVKDLNEKHKILETAKELSAAAKEHATIARTKTEERFEELDAKYHVREKFAVAAEKSKGAALELNERLHLSEYAMKVADAGREVAKDIDSRFQVSEHASRLKQKAVENEGVQGIIGSFKKLSAKATDYYYSKFGNVSGSTERNEPSASEEYELSDNPTSS
eukprot:jgi/Galph1/2198/GphlegSOOS_G881.1